MVSAYTSRAVGGDLSSWGVTYRHGEREQALERLAGVLGTLVAIEGREWVADFLNEISPEVRSGLDLRSITSLDMKAR